MNGPDKWATPSSVILSALSSKFPQLIMFQALNGFFSSNSRKSFLKPNSLVRFVTEMVQGPSINFCFSLLFIDAIKQHHIQK